MSRKLVAANWKMNLTQPEADALVAELIQGCEQSSVPVVLGVPHPFLSPVHHLIDNKQGFHLAAQNLHQEHKGAYTGEVSAPMLKSLGVEYVIIGHSERRQQFSESDAMLSRKVEIALEYGLKPIFCVGETAEQREQGETEAVVTDQLKAGLFHLQPELLREVVLAYEPIWAIGTGKTATPEDANAVHQTLRQTLAEHFSEQLAEDTTILYGGSVKPANAKDLFAQEHIDGGLVGGASLKAESFLEIITAAEAA